MAVRKIGNKHSSLSGLFKSFKNNRLIGFESSLESDFAEILEFDAKVEKYIEQPARITFPNGWYFPDFLVLYSNSAKLKHGVADTYYEVKYSTEIEKHKEEFEEKFNKARTAINEMGFGFEIITEKEIRTPYLDNVKFLNHYKHQHVDPILKDLVIKAITDLGFTTPKKVLEQVSGGFYEKAHSIFIIWHLISTNVVFADIRDPLTMETEICLNN